MKTMTENINWYKYCIKGYRYKRKRKELKRDYFWHLIQHERYRYKRVEMAMPLIMDKLLLRGYKNLEIEKSPFSETVYIYIKKLDQPFKNYIKIRVSCHGLLKNNADVNIYV